MSGLFRELWFLWKDRAAKVWLAIAFLAASISVFLGLAEVSSQRDTIDRLLEADQIEREAVAAAHSDWGSAAYYTFHLTYDPPSNFAFASLGQRDISPWKHRIRMLALEGQIHESDAANPEFALIGRFDFAFVAAMIAPLFLILLLHDLRASERVGGRYELLSSTSSEASGPWMSRASWRVSMLAIATLIPLWTGAVIGDSASSAVLIASFALILHLCFWWALAAWINAQAWTSTVNLTALIGAWLALAVVAPLAIKSGIDAAIPVPDGGDIMLTQREAVNDAWDLPKDATMGPFLERHPELVEYGEIAATFEWKWYYAFQQVGDQIAEPLSYAYRDGKARRDNLASVLSWLSPPSKVERVLQSVAGTDARAAAAYEARVRAYHAALRDYYYSNLFPEHPFTSEAIAKRPDFQATSES
ncbi:MAG: DUF3526 domain-containing protein [Pseudomonadota bacterium]